MPMLPKWLYKIMQDWLSVAFTYNQTLVGRSVGAPLTEGLSFKFLGLN
jgi:hypothetical protein